MSRPVRVDSQVTREPAADRPPSSSQPPVGPPGDRARRRGESRKVGHRERDVGRGAPRHHGRGRGGARAQHLAGPVARPHHHRDPGPQSQLGRGGGRERPGHGGRIEHGREPVADGGHQCLDRSAGGVGQTGGRDHGGVGDHLSGQSPDDQVAGGEQPAGGGQAVGFVGGQPGHLGRHRRPVEDGAGAGLHRLHPTESGRHRVGLDAGAAIRPHQGRSQGLAVGGDTDDGLAGAGETDGLHGGEGGGGAAAGRRRRRPPAPATSRPGPARPGPAAGWWVVSPARPAVRGPSPSHTTALVVEVPRSRVRINRRAPRRPPGGPSSPARGSLEHLTADGHPGRPPGHGVGHLVEHGLATGLAPGTAQEEHRHPHRSHHPGHGGGAVAAGGGLGHRHLQQRRPHVVGDDRGGHDRVGVAGHGPVAPGQGLDQRLHPGRPGLVDHLAQQLQGRGREGIGAVDAGHVLDPGPAVGRGPVDARDQAVVELEHRSGQAGAVDGQVGALPRSNGPRRGQVGQRLAGGQDAVAGRQGGGQGGHIGPVALDGHDPPGPVVGGQDERRALAPVGGRRRHSTPAAARTTLARAEKSSRP